MADNTDVEWAYGFDKGASGGLLTTSNQAHSVELPSDFNYSNLIHNHAQTLEGSGYSQREIIEYNSCPSREDRKRMKDLALDSAAIYNEVDGKYYDYNLNSPTQEDKAKEFGWELKEYD